MVTVVSSNRESNLATLPLTCRPWNQEQSIVGRAAYLVHRHIVAFWESAVRQKWSPFFLSKFPANSNSYEALTFGSVAGRAWNYEGRMVGEYPSGSDAENDYRSICNEGRCNCSPEQLRLIISHQHSAEGKQEVKYMVFSSSERNPSWRQQIDMLRAACSWIPNQTVSSCTLRHWGIEDRVAIGVKVGGGVDES
jgi:hypothetical protein